MTPANLPESALDDLADLDLAHWTARYAESAAAARTALRPFVLVRVGGERFAVALDDLDEVACVTTGIALPHVNPLILGLANIRGELLPLLDTAAILDVAAGYRLGTANRTLVVRDRRGRRTGLPVDGVESVEELDPDLFQTMTRGESTDLVRRNGLAEHRGRALARLDLTPLRAGSFSHF